MSLFVLGTILVVFEHSTVFSYIYHNSSPAKQAGPIAIKHRENEVQNDPIWHFSYNNCSVFENERKDVTWNDELEQFANFRTKQIYLF